MSSNIELVPDESLSFLIVLIVMSIESVVFACAPSCGAGIRINVCIFICSVLIDGILVDGVAEVVVIDKRVSVDDNVTVSVGDKDGVYEGFWDGSLVGDVDGIYEGS